MGQTYCNNCCTGEKLTAYESDIQLYKKNIDHTPLQTFAVQVKSSIELNIYVKQIFAQYHTPHISQKNGGIKLNMHYLFNYAAYYDGEWKNGLPHGLGKLIYDDGSLYFGCFNEGIASCNNALFIFNNGAFYRGYVRSNKANGQGELCTNKLNYKGTWKNDLPEGKGVERYSPVSFYEGNFISGKKQGKGLYSWNKHQYYIGQFNNNLMDGEGELHLRDFEYNGQFKKGQKSGKGILTCISKKWKYEGEFKNDMMDGIGVYTWEDGTKFSGRFENNERTDDGKIILPNNKVLETSLVVK